MSAIYAMDAMNLSHLSSSERTALAVRLGRSPKYFYQCAKGIRRVSPELAREIVLADPRMTLEELLFQAPESPKEAA